MNKLGKLAPIIVIIVSLGSLYLAFTLGSMKKAQLAQIADLKDTVTKTTADLNKTKGTLKQTQTDLTTTKSNLVQTTATLATTKSALDQKTTEANALLTQLTDTTNQLALTKADLATAQSTVNNIQSALKDVGITNIVNIADLRNRIVSMGEENGVLGKQLTVLHAENEQLKAQVVELSTTPVGLRGHVSLVDGKWGFVVMDLGHDQRVQPKSEFLVYRNSKFVAKVQVTAVAADNCVAQILPDYLKHPPLAGDLVVH
jgi:multidrug efflux pump subunit AcrA (membrane-fusion protein)